jgi:hypothetical protein
MHMFYYHIKRHRYKIVAGVPIAILVATSLSFSQGGYSMCVTPETNRYVTIGDTVSLDLVAQADEPINVIGATVVIPTQFVELLEVSKSTSVIDLWSEEPTLTKDALTFSGGIMRSGGLVGSGNVLTLLIRPHTEGVATFTLQDSKMYAHDGTGREVACSTNALSVWVRPADHPSPDVNNDNAVNMLDIGIVSTHLYFRYSSKHDLNVDGKIDFEDMRILFAHLKKSGPLESLAITAPPLW